MITKERLAEIKASSPTTFMAFEEVLREVILSHEIAFRWIDLKNQRLDTCRGAFKNLFEEYRKVEVQLIELEEERDAKN